MDKIREAIQQHLDDEGEGWNVDQFVVAMGLVRINSDGEVESLPWVISPASQPDWQTEGLLHKATTIQTCVGVDPD